MIEIVFLPAVRNTGFSGEDKRTFDKFQAEALKNLDKCLNAGFRIVDRPKKLDTTLGTQFFYLLHKPDEEPTP